MNLNYLMDHSLYQMFKIIFSIFLKKYNEKIDNPSIRIYVHKNEIGLHLRLKQDVMLSF